MENEPSLNPYIVETIPFEQHDLEPLTSREYDLAVRAINFYIENAGMDACTQSQMSAARKRLWHEAVLLTIQECNKSKTYE